MILQALLVSKDDLSAETLIRVLAQLGVAVDRSSSGDVALSRLAEEHFDQFIVDFDDPDTAFAVLEACGELACRPDRNPPITVALLREASQMRSIIGMGAHFILTKPVNPEQALNTLRAATAVLKRERRQSLRVSLQAPVSIALDSANAVEGILLDLSTGGIDLLAAKPLPSGATVRFSFQLPEGGAIEGSANVAWSTDNGQTGLHFVEMDGQIRAEMERWLAGHSHYGGAEEAETRSQCKLTDLSLGGCYVETDSPLPQSSAVDLCLRAGEMEIHTEGLVRVMHPGHGMGIEFPARTEQQRQSVGKFIEFLTRQPGASPLLEVSPRCLIGSAINLGENSHTETDSDDPLLRLLRTGELLDEEAFIAELRRQRNPEGVPQ